MNCFVLRNKAVVIGYPKNKQGHPKAALLTYYYYQPFFIEGL
jgi:hypothetical protein